jgi:hypothetical protein
MEAIMSPNQYAETEFEEALRVVGCNKKGTQYLGV